MPSTYVDLHCHVVFGTKHRKPQIAGEWRSQLHQYLGGTLRGLGVVPTAIGGTEDHVHLLMSLRTTHAVADVVREVKKSSSAWVKDTHRVPTFAWQEGYAAFSVSAGHRANLIQYISTQEAHHKKVSPLDELRALLEEAGIEYDPAYLE